MKESYIEGLAIPTGISNQEGFMMEPPRIRGVLGVASDRKCGVARRNP
jgi:hypothetical protein